MNKTKIEWVKNPDNKTLGWVWNPLTGCLNHDKGMCKGGNFPCYAYKLAMTRLKERYLANSNLAKREIVNDAENLYCIGDHDPFYPRFWEDKVDKMSMYTGVGKGIFVCGMSDLFGIGVPEQWTNQVFQAIKFNPRNRFYLLTKQPQNLIKFSPFPDNCWVGVTATDNEMYQLATLYLNRIEAKVKYVSLEPLLGRIEFYDLPMYGLNWVIIGAQTKPYKPPRIEWVKEIVEACDKAGVKVFLKENLRPLLQQNKHNLYSFPEWAGTQFAVTGNHSLATVNPHPNEAMRKYRQEMPG